MKILVVGDGRAEIHEVAVLRAFQKLGHDVMSFFWHSYFISNGLIRNRWLRIQNKYLIGPAFKKMNSDFVAQAIRFGPELIFIYRGTHILPQATFELRAALPKCIIFGYNNDDPFGPQYPRYVWRHFFSGLSHYHLVFAYRPHNVEEYIRTGARRVELLMPWFVAEKDYPVSCDYVDKCNEFVYDVVFVGHYENDRRLTFLKALAESELSFGLFGPDWERAPAVDWLSKMKPIRAVRGNEYREVICSSRIAICLFSELNRDTYTRRCFEIPAMKTFMLSEFSDDMSRLFREGVEVDYFRSVDEMMIKVRRYLKEDDLRRAIADAGFRRVHLDKHDVLSRMESVISIFNSWPQEG